MSRYIKSHSNYTLRKQHQLTKDGTIFERDWVTIGGTQRFTPGQTPVYSNGNFIFTINNTPSYQKKQKYGHWVVSPNGDSDWTDGEVEDVNLPNTNSDIEINEISNDLRDFAYFGSCVELVRASIEDIIKYFPSELYFSGKIAQIVTGSTEDINPFKVVDGFIVDNDFNINLINSNVILTEYENDLHYFSYSYSDYEIISGETKTPISSVVITNEDVNINCLTEGQLLNTITINGNIKIYGRFVNGERMFFHNSSIGLHIRPNEKRINDYFKQLDGFEKILLKRKCKPIYTNTFLTPIETDKGIVFINRDYSWPINNGWNLDISSPSYLSFFNNLLSISQILDDYYCDNIYRSMTHEAIKNFDWTYTREYTSGDEQEYIIAGTKITNLLRIYGRMFDDIKRYIDGIKFTNTLTYDKKNNIPDYFLSDKLELNGWDVSSIIKNGTENELTDILYTGESTGYTYTEVNNMFMRRLALCSKAIFKAKGTRHAIEMLLGMFGVGVKGINDEENNKKINLWCEINEYHYICSPITDENNISLIKSINREKSIELNDENNPYSGLLVKEIKDGDKVYLVPWFDKKKNYDGNPYFQFNGGWGSEFPFPLDNGNFVYKETMPYINIVPTLNDLFILNIGRIMPNDVYYVYDITDIGEYNFNYDNSILSGNPTNYFILNNGNTTSDENTLINNSRNSSGWTCVTYDVINKEKIISNERVVYLESIISKNNSNNPHIGYGHYDMGKEFFDYLRELFKYALDNSKISGDETELESYKKLGFTDINFNIPIKDPIKIQNIDILKYECGKDNKIEKDIKNVFLNTKLLVIKNLNIDLTNDNESEKKFKKEFREYFTEVILPYIEQLIPSTTIFGIEGFGEEAGKYLTLSTNEIKLNDSMNTILSKDVTLNSSGGWGSAPISTLTDITPNESNNTNEKLTVKKKDEKKYGSEKITFFLKEDNSISSVLNITVSQISSSDINFDNASGGTKQTNVIVNGLNDNPTFYYTNSVSWANVVKNGNTLIVSASKNNDPEQRNGSIIVYNFNDNNCYWIINVTQVGAEISINSSCLYQSKINDTPNCINNVPYTGGTYFIDVEAIGGAKDYTFKLNTITSNIEDDFIIVKKINSKLLQLIISENSLIRDISYECVFTHISDSSVTAITSFTLLKASGLNILINGQTEVDGVVQYIGGNVTPSFIVDAIGASKTWDIEPSSIPSWLTVTKNVNNLIITADDFSLTISREARIIVYHHDDKSIQAFINVTQKGVGELSIVATPNNIIFNSNGGGVIVSVNVYGGLKNYTFSPSCNWIILENNVVGDFGDYKEYKLIVSASQYNDTTRSRNCEILLIHSNNTTITESINITQESATEYSIYATKIGETTPVTIVNDIPFTQTTEINGRKFDVYVTPINAGYNINTTATWINTSTNGNVLTVWFNTNSTSGERSAEIILKNGLDTTKTHTILFTQAGAGLLFIGGKLPSEIEYLSGLSMIFNANDSSKTIDIKVEGGDGDFILDTVTSKKYPWLHISPTSGKTGVVTITCDENKEDNNRNGVILLLHKNNTDYSFVVNVQQNQGYQLTIQPNDGANNINVSTMLDIAQSGIIKTFTVAATGGDAMYKFIGNNVDWIKVDNNPLTSLSGGTSNTILKLQVLPNDSGVVRNATVVFEHVNDSSKKVSIIINQLIVVYDILIDNEKIIQWNEIDSFEISKTFNITVSGGSLQYIIDNPIECTYDEITGVYTDIVGSSADWVNEFNEGNILTLDINENGLSVIRAAKVRVRHADKPNEFFADVYLWQKGAVIEYKNYLINVNPTGKTYNSEGGITNVTVTSTRDKYINGNFISKENVPYQIKIEDDVPITYTNIFKVDGLEIDKTYNIEITGNTIEMGVVSVLKNDVTGSENYIVWNVTSDANWLKIKYRDDSRVTIVIDENMDIGDRIGHLKFVQDKENPKTIIFTYNQGHYVYSLTINKENNLLINALASGSTINVEIVSKKYDSLFPTFIKDIECNVQLDFDEWGTQTENGKIITVNENNTDANRIGIVTYKQIDINGASAKLTITQAFYMYVFEVNGTTANGTSPTVEFDSDGETKTIVLKSYCYDSIDINVYYSIKWESEYTEPVSVIPYSGNTINEIPINVNITMSKNESIESGRTSTVIFKQNKSNKYVNVPLNQPLKSNVIWIDPSENTNKNIDVAGGSFIAYADTTGLTYEDIVVSKDPNDTWVTVNPPTQGDNKYGKKAVKVEITVLDNKDIKREMSIIIEKK